MTNSLTISTTQEQQAAAFIGDSAYRAALVGSVETSEYFEVERLLANWLDTLTYEALIGSEE